MSRNGKAQLAEVISSFAVDPLGYSIFAFPWNTPGTALDGHVGPRRWQREVMREIGDHLSDPATRFQPLRLAVASGHGAGKSAAIAMIANWALDTCPDCRVVITANTEGQLLTKTVPELIKWRQAAVTRDWFKTSAMS